MKATTKVHYYNAVILKPNGEKILQNFWANNKAQVKRAASKIGKLLEIY